MLSYMLIIVMFICSLFLLIESKHYARHNVSDSPLSHCCCRMLLLIYFQGIQINDISSCRKCYSTHYLQKQLKHSDVKVATPTFTFIVNLRIFNVAFSKFIQFNTRWEVTSSEKYDSISK